MNWRSANLRGSPEDSRFARQPCRDSGEWNRVERPFLKLATSTRVLQSGQKQYNPLNPTERAKKWCIAPVCSDLFQSIRLQVTSIWERTFVRLWKRKCCDVWLNADTVQKRDRKGNPGLSTIAWWSVYNYKHSYPWYCVTSIFWGIRGRYDSNIGNMSADQQSEPVFAQW